VEWKTIDPQKPGLEECTQFIKSQTTAVNITFKKNTIKHHQNEEKKKKTSCTVELENSEYPAATWAGGPVLFEGVQLAGKTE